MSVHILPGEKEAIVDRVKHLFENKRLLLTADVPFSPLHHFYKPLWSKEDWDATMHLMERDKRVAGDSFHPHHQNNVLKYIRRMSIYPTNEWLLKWMGLRDDPMSPFTPARMITNLGGIAPIAPDAIADELPERVQMALAKYLTRVRAAHIERASVRRTARLVLQPIRTTGQLFMVCPVLLTLMPQYRREEWRNYRGKPAFPKGAYSTLTGKLNPWFEPECLDRLSSLINGAMLLPKYEEPEGHDASKLQVYWEQTRTGIPLVTDL